MRPSSSSVGSMFTVLLTKKALKQLNQLPTQYRDRIRMSLRLLETNPFAGKKLEGQYEGRYTLRVWPYRIVYRIEKKILFVNVIAIGHRQGVYK